MTGSNKIIFVVLMLSCGGSSGCIQRNDGPTGYVSYSPPIIPVTVALNSRGVISVTVSGKIQTPIGTFAAGLSDDINPPAEHLFIVVRKNDTEDEQVYKLPKHGKIDFDGPVLLKTIDRTSESDRIIVYVADVKPQTTELNNQPLVAEASPAPVPERFPEPTPSSSNAMVLPTLTQFARGFHPTGGRYHVGLIHPITHAPVQMQFTLPYGSPKVKVKHDELEFKYDRAEVKLKFRRDGKVKFDYDT